MNQGLSVRQRGENRRVVYTEELKPIKAVKVKLSDKAEGAWDLVFSGAGSYLGKGVYEVSDRSLKALDEKKVKYTLLE